MREWQGKHREYLKENPQLRRGYWREEPIDGKESHDIIDSSDWRVAPFSTQERFQEHVSEHLKDYGDIRPIDYLNKAGDLLAAPLSKDVEGFVDSEGYVFKYRISTNEFAVGRPDGKISTLYKPDRGAGYWEDEKKLRGI